MNFSITKNGKPLSKKLYKWDEETRTFSTNEIGLIIDFSGIDEVTFKTDHSCTFMTGSGCNFDTGNHCTFSTGDNCTFKTGYWCTFKTGRCCTFSTVENCTFNTYVNCTFDTGSQCTFNTSCKCTFKTGKNCTFLTGENCTFLTGENCFAIRYDVPNVTEIPPKTIIKFNKYKISGYTKVNPTHTIMIDGEKVVISDESYQNLKNSLTS